MNPELKFKAAPVGSLWVVKSSKHFTVAHIIPETSVAAGRKNWPEIQELVPGSVIMKLGITEIDEHSDIEKVLTTSKEGELLVGWLFGHSISFLIPYEEHQVQERVTIRKPWTSQGLLGGTRKD